MVNDTKPFIASKIQKLFSKNQTNNSSTYVSLNPPYLYMLQTSFFATLKFNDDFILSHLRNFGGFLSNRKTPIE